MVPAVPTLAVRPCVRHTCRRCGGMARQYAWASRSRMAASSSQPKPSTGPPAAGAADLELVRAALAGAREVEPRLVDCLTALPAMIRLKHQRLGGHLDATELEDVLQSTLLAVWRKLERYDGRVRLLHWAYGFAVFE